MFDAHAHIGITTDKALVNTSSPEEARSALGFRYLSAGLLPGYDNLTLYDELLKSGLYAGEIGIDKRFEEKSKQVKLFKEALFISKSYDRLVTIHAVGYTDELLRILDEIRPKRFILHGFAGSYETAKEIVNRNGVISLGPRSLKAKSFQKLITLPFVVESDMKTGDDQLNSLKMVIKAIDNLVSFNTEEKTEKLMMELLNG